MNPELLRTEAQRERQVAQQNDYSEYPRMHRHVHASLAQALEQQAAVVEELGEPKPATTFAEKRAGRVERLRRKAAMLRVEAARRSVAAHTIAARRPFGQPILVGHHSERGHRRDLERQRRLDDKAMELRAAAAAAERSAEACENNDAIFSDDPDAVAKLREKAEAMKQLREKMKARNAAYRKCKGDLDKMDLPDEVRYRMKAKREGWFMGADKWRPHAAYELSNLGANLRRVEQRIRELEAAQATPAQVVETAAGVRMEDVPADNRVRLFFPGKPEEQVRRELKRSGFRWAPSLGCWQAYRNYRSLAHAQGLVKGE